jgi:hypothetical protein
VLRTEQRKEIFFYSVLSPFPSVLFFGPQSFVC